MKLSIQRSGGNAPVFLATLSIVFIAVAKFAAAEDDPTLKAVEANINAVERIVNDDFVNETRLQEARKSLQALLEEARAAAVDLKEERAAELKAVQLQVRLIELLAKIEARLPDAFDETGDGQRSGFRSAFPVPGYEAGKLTGQAAQELITAQKVLMAHLKSSPDDTEKTSRLLNRLVLAEENLAWEAGWPFSAEEVAQLKKAGGLTEEIYLSRRNRGIERVNQRLTREREGVGRSVPRAFVIHHPLSAEDQQQIEKALTEQRGSVQGWMKDTVPFNDHERDVLLGKITEEQEREAAREEESTEATDTNEPAADDSARTWSDRTGQFQVQAALVSVTDGQVKLRKAENDQVIEIPLERLSDADQEFIKSLVE